MRPRLLLACLLAAVATAGEVPEDSNGNLLLFDSTTLLLRSGSAAVVCHEPLDAPAVGCDGPVAPDLELPPDGAATTFTGRFLARVSGGRLYDSTFVRGWVTAPPAGGTTEEAEMDLLAPPYTTAAQGTEGPSVLEFLDVRSCADVEAASAVPLHHISPPPDGASPLCIVESPDLERPSHLPPEELGVSVLYVPQHLDPASESSQEIVDAGGVLVHTSVSADGIACPPQPQGPGERTCLPTTVGPHAATVGRPEVQRAVVQWRTHAALVRTVAGAAFGGVVLLAATGGFLLAIFDSESSTAAIGLVTALVGGTFPLAFVALGLDRMVEAWELDDWPRLRAHLTASSAVTGAIAGCFTITAVAKLVNTTEADHPLPLAAAVVATAVATSLLVARALSGPRARSSVT